MPRYFSVRFTISKCFITFAFVLSKRGFFKALLNCLWWVTDFIITLHDIMTFLNMSEGLSYKSEDIVSFNQNTILTPTLTHTILATWRGFTGPALWSLHLPSLLNRMFFHQLPPCSLPYLFQIFMPKTARSSLIVLFKSESLPCKPHTYSWNLPNSCSAFSW